MNLLSNTVPDTAECPHKNHFSSKGKETSLVHAVRLMSLRASQIPHANTATFKATTLAIFVICGAKWDLHSLLLLDF